MYRAKRHESYETSHVFTWTELFSVFHRINFVSQYYCNILEHPYLPLSRYYQCCYRFSVNLWLTQNCAWLVSLLCVTANQVQRCSTWLSSSSITSAPIKCDHSWCLTSRGWHSLNILAMKRCKLKNCYLSLQFTTYVIQTGRNNNHTIFCLSNQKRLWKRTC